MMTINNKLWMLETLVVLDMIVLQLLQTFDVNGSGARAEGIEALRWFSLSTGQVRVQSRTRVGFKIKQRAT